MTTIKINSSLKALNILAPDARHLDTTQLAIGVHKRTVEKMARDIGVDKITVQRLLSNQLPASPKHQLQTLKTFLRQALDKTGTTKKGNEQIVRAYINDVDRALDLKEAELLGEHHAATALVFTAALEIAQEKLAILGRAVQLANLGRPPGPGLGKALERDMKKLVTLEKEVTKASAAAVAAVRSHPGKTAFMARLKEEVLAPLQRLREAKRT